jgi:2-polyprenyl-3-methyl-5-hydroxy-6-metoxy-1,4-benzoquinol methylase
MIEIAICPACGSAKWEAIFPVKDYSISGEEFQLKKCSTCSIVVTSPRPEDDKLGAYYESDDYISHSGTSSGIVNLIYLQARKFSLQWKLNLIENLKPKGKLLDVGCGTGEFLKTAQQNAWNISGVEPNDLARERAEKLLNIKLTKSIIQSIDNQDIITLWHVLEHLPDLNTSLERINSILSKDGKLLIAVPNHSSLDALEYQKYWAAYDVPRHLWHFNRKSMALLLQKHGMKIERVVPMKLDSYYVSLLSEKYIAGGKSTLTSLLKGFLSGLRSNLGGRKTGEYSSLIYIASK